MLRKNVLHVRDSGGLYGAERVILNIFNHVDKKRFNLKLLVFDNHEGSAKEFYKIAKSRGIKILEIKTKGRFSLEVIKKLRSILTEESIDKIHSHDFKSNFYSIFAAYNLGIKKTVTSHGSTRDSLLKKMYLFFDEYIFYLFFDTIIAVSEKIYSKLKRNPFLQKQTVFIQNGIDSSHFHNNIINKQSSSIINKINADKVFGVIGRLFPDKGHIYFLEAFSNIVKFNENVHALIVGDGPESEALLKKVESLHMSEYVHFTGFTNNMEEIYNSIDLLILPSLREGLPYVILESMLYKIPIIATNVGEIPKLILHKETGYLIESQNVNSLEQGIKYFLKNPALIKNMAENAYNLVNKEYSAKRMVESIEDIYSSL